MSHYIVEGGAFAHAFEAMPHEHLLPWTCWEPQDTDKGKSFRFDGITEWRPLAAWDPEWERLLTEAEDRELEALMSSLAGRS